MPVVWIPSLVQRATGAPEHVRVPAGNVRRIIETLEVMYPGIRAELVDDLGAIQPGIAVAIDGETNHLGLIQRVAEESEVHFIPAIAGGEPDGDDAPRRL
jgi:molybdopterin converting factor small subunit